MFETFYEYNEIGYFNDRHVAGSRWNYREEQESALYYLICFMQFH